MSLSDIQQMWIAGAQTPSGKLQPYCFVVRGGGVQSSPAQQAQKVMEGGLSSQGKSTFPIRCFSSVVHVLGSCGPPPLPLRKAEPQKLEVGTEAGEERHRQWKRRQRVLTQLEAGILPPVVLKNDVSQMFTCWQTS
jgi:hypothetical protein